MISMASEHHLLENSSNCRLYFTGSYMSGLSWPSIEVISAKRTTSAVLFAALRNTSHMSISIALCLIRNYGLPTHWIPVLDRVNLISPFGLIQKLEIRLVTNIIRKGHTPERVAFAKKFEQKCHDLNKQYNSNKMDRGLKRKMPN